MVLKHNGIENNLLEIGFVCDLLCIFATELQKQGLK